MYHDATSIINWMYIFQLSSPGVIGPMVYVDTVPSALLISFVFSVNGLLFAFPSVHGSQISPVFSFFPSSRLSVTNCEAFGNKFWNSETYVLTRGWILGLRG